MGLKERFVNCFKDMSLSVFLALIVHKAHMACHPGSQKHQPKVGYVFINNKWYISAHSQFDKGSSSLDV